MKLTEIRGCWKGGTREYCVAAYGLRLQSISIRQPGDYIAGISVRGKDRIENVLDYSIADHQRHAFQQPHSAGLKSWQAQCFRKLEMSIRENRKWKVQAVSNFALIGRLLG